MTEEESQALAEIMGGLEHVKIEMQYNRTKETILAHPPM